MTELFSCYLSVAVIAKVAGVVVLVAASKGKRLDVVDDGRELHAVTSLAQLAQAGRSGHAPLPLTLPSPTAEALDGHITASRYEESRNPCGRGSNNWSSTYDAGVMSSTAFTICSLSFLYRVDLAQDF